MISLDCPYQPFLLFLVTSW